MVVVTRNAGNVTIALDERTAWKVAEVMGMLGGDEATEVYSEVFSAFGQPRSGGLKKYDAWLSKMRKLFRLREPYANHAGVITFDKPGKHGEHNHPHFPCNRRRTRKRGR